MMNVINAIEVQLKWFKWQISFYIDFTTKKNSPEIYSFIVPEARSLKSGYLQG